MRHASSNLAVTKFLAVLVLALSSVSPVVRASDAAVGADASVFLEAPELLVFVHPLEGKDENPGSREKPVRSLTKALNIGRSPYESGKRVGVVLGPGVYREEIAVTLKPRQVGGYLWITAAQPNSVFLSGADNWTGNSQGSAEWKQESDGTFSKEWKLRWGFDPNGFAHGPDETLNQTLIARREYVSIGKDRTLRQVLKRSELAPGTFQVDETTGRLYVRPPDGLDPNRDHIEVATRPEAVEWNRYLFSIGKCVNLRLSKLSFIHSGSYPNGAALYLGRETRNVIVEDCSFSHNGSSGLALAHSENAMECVNDITIRHSSFLRNGMGGLIGGCQNGLIIDCKFEENNVRGNWSDFFGWSIAGCKLFRTNRLLVQQCLFTGNHTGGLWFDVDCTDVEVKSCKIAKNFGKHSKTGEHEERGLFVEICKGPILIEDCEVTNNWIGLQVGNSENVTIERCLIANNLHTQFGLECRPRGDEFPPFNRNLVLTENTIAASNDQMLIREIWSADDDRIERSRKAFPSYRFGNNRYEYEGDQLPFEGLDLDTPGTGWQDYAFNAWKQRTGLDRNGSTFNGHVSVGGFCGASIPASLFDSAKGCELNGTCVAGLGENAGEESWVCFRDFDFGNGASLVEITIGVNDKYAGGSIEIRLDAADGPKIGELRVTSTGGFGERARQTAKVNSPTGVHDVYFVGRGKKLVGNFYNFAFHARMDGDRSDQE